jgi:hypothetical protein
LIPLTGAEAINASDKAQGVIDRDPCFVDVDNGNFRLSKKSGCIDAGVNLSLYDFEKDDLDGLPRFIDDLCTANTGIGLPPVIDIGAYEFLASDMQQDGDVDYSDFRLLANNWLLFGPSPCSSADLDCDGDVDMEDLSLLCNNWLAGI